MKKYLAAAILASSVIASFSNAQAAEFKDPLPKAFKDGKAYIDSRYRFEYVDDSSPATPNKAKSSTLRTRVGFTSGQFLRDTIGNIEFENISSIQDKPYYNDGSNGRTSYATVADPVGTELNQLFLRTDAIENTIITLGRQRIAFDNERFVGDIGWRQNDQTFDALTINNNTIKNLDFAYSYVTNVNRVFGEDAPQGDWDSESHLLHIEYDLERLFKVGAYAYFLEIEDSAANSSETYGTFIDGQIAANRQLNITYRAEYAMQSDYENNPNSYDADYYHLKLGANMFGIKGGFGYEVLESEGTANTAFRTPLGTNHAFNGWADLFLTTPANGLEDMYFSLGYDHKSRNKYLHNISVLFTYHDFQAENGGGDYGEEFDVLVRKQINKNWSFGVKYANFSADSASAFNDREMISTWLGVKLSQ